jgi:hypothetical protein
LNLIPPPHHSHHSGARTGLKRPDQRSPFFAQDLGHMKLLAVDVADGKYHYNDQKNDNGTNYHPG